MAITQKHSNIHFGKDQLEHWCLDPNRLHLNHGAYGAITKATFNNFIKIFAQIEQAPAYFIRTQLPERLREQANLLAQYTCSAQEDLVFIDNASAGANAVLRALSLMPHDEVIITNMTYESVRQVVLFVCDRAGATVTEVSLNQWTANESELLYPVLSAITSRTRLIVMDHITSPSAQLFPITTLAMECQQRGIEILIDGAHSPGMIPIDIPSYGCQWYIGNAHKWLGAPRGTAFLWVHPDQQNFIRPCVITRTLHDSFTRAFDWPGSRDFAAWLSIEDILKNRTFQNESAMQDYAAALAKQAAQELASHWSTRFNHMDKLAMSLVELPAAMGKTPQDAIQLETILAKKYHIDTQIISSGASLYIRLSAWVYNTLQDYKDLAKAINNIIKEN